MFLNVSLQGQCDKPNCWLKRLRNVILTLKVLFFDEFA